MTEQEKKSPDASPSELNFAWYVLQVISGHEEKFHRHLMHQIGLKSEMAPYIKEVFLPLEQHSTVKEGRRFNRKKSITPGYVYVLMHLTPESMDFVVKTPSALGFLGGPKTSRVPVPVSAAEVEALREKVTEKPGKTGKKLEFAEGCTVRILEGPFANMTAIYESFNDKTEKATVVISMFGRDTQMEIVSSNIELAKDGN